MADESRWGDDDRYGRRDERWWRPGSGPRGDREDWLRYGRDYGEPYRGFGRDRDDAWRDQDRESGTPWRMASRDRGEYWRGEERDARPAYREFRRETGYGGPGTQGRFGRDYGRDYGREENRGWFERAADEVSSWFGDDEAQRRREHDAIAGSHRGRGPKGYLRPDERIREDVCDRLTDDSLVDASDIEVAVMGSEVTLSGTVQSREERRRAEDCAERVLGVAHVQNNLRLSQAGNASGTATGRNAGNAIEKGTGQRPGRAAH